MNRRTLLLGSSAVAASRAFAQPLPVISDAVPPRIGAGPLWSMSSGPPGATLSLSFMTPGTLDPRITFTRASTATYFDNTGTVQTAATNAPRWDYNPSTLTLRGLLIEEARTNLAYPGAGFSGWLASNTTITTGVAGAPDGTATMAKLAEAATTSSHYTASVFATVASTAYTASVFAKAAGGRYLQLSINDNPAATTGAFATFDLQSGVISGPLTAIGAGVIGTAAIQPVGGGTYRCSIAGTIGANTSLRLALLTSNVASPVWAPSYAGNIANGILIWGPQLEAGAFPTSYIQTAAAAVTRSADVASMPTAAWFSTTTGTYQVEFIPNGAAATLPVAISGNAGSPVVAIGSDGRLVASIRSGAAVFSATGPLFTFGAVNKAAFAYLSGASAAAVKGTAIGPSAVALSVTGTTVEFGSDGVTPGNNALDGWLRRVSYWPRVLSNTELQQVTT